MKIPNSSWKTLPVEPGLYAWKPSKLIKRKDRIEYIRVSRHRTNFIVGQDDIAYCESVFWDDFTSPAWHKSGVWYGPLDEPL